MSENIPKEISNSQHEDFETITRIVNGELNAFGILQEKYKGIIYSLIRKMVKDEDDIDDLVQETFIKAYRAIERYNPEFSFSAWIYRIASNTCIDFLRRKRLNIISLDKPIGASDDDEGLYLEIEDNSYQADTVMLNEEKTNTLYNAIENLPEKYRIIIKLRHEEEMDYNEIATKLNMPLGTVKAHLFRARKLLLDELRKVNHLFQS